MAMLALVLATGIVGLVVLQLGLATYSSALRVARERDQRKLADHFWWEQIEVAKAVRSRHQLEAPAWSGHRKFVVDKKIPEGEGICSFYLIAHDGKPLPRFKPGQYLTFRLDIAGQEKPVIRCYSLSDCPRPDYYRVTIKCVPPPPDNPDAPPGLCSNYFHQHIQEGDILDVKAPGGHFVLDPIIKKPAVLIAGGVGITPMLSMLNSIASAGSTRDVWLFHGVRNGREHVAKDHFRNLALEHDNIHVVTCYSEPDDSDVEGRDYDHEGHITVELLKGYLKTNNYRFFMCGPPPMMKAVTADLKNWGVPKDDIRTEAFGPASVKAKKDAAPPASAEPATAPIAYKIVFAKTGKEFVWENNALNLLEFATSNGIEIDSACCAGGCGTCQVAVKSGQVCYDDEPECQIEEGCCLTCVGRPDGDLVLDA